MAPSQQNWRMPVWVPLAIIAVSVIAIVICCGHLIKRSKAKWPW